MCVVVCLLTVLALWGCGRAVTGGDTCIVESELYSQADIDSAIDTIKTEFRKDWHGCTLTEIYYAGDEKSKEHQEWADRNDGDQAIVLLSSFEVDASGGDGSLNPNSIYTNWMWILVRSDNGPWRHVDHGY